MYKFLKHTLYIAVLQTVSFCSETVLGWFSGGGLIWFKKLFRDFFHPNSKIVKSSFIVML